MSLIYLDNAATSFPKAPGVYDAVDQWMRGNGAAYGRGIHAAAGSSTDLVEQCRRQVAALLGIESASATVFTFNCTDSLNLLLRGILNAGDRVLSSQLEHNSVLRPLTQLSKELNLQVDYVPFDAESGEISVTEFQRQAELSPVRLAVLSHASNVTGVVQPVRQLADITHAAGAMLLVDAAQTAGHFPMNMRELEIDFLAAAGHKGLLGPLGTGVLAVRPGLEGLIRPVRCGGTGTSSESPEQPAAMPGRFESGNLNMPGLAGLYAATRWLQTVTVQKVHSQVADLSERLRMGLRDIPSVKIFADAGSAQRTGIIAFNIGNMDCREAATILEQSFEIQCRPGLHCAPMTHSVLGTAPWGGAIRLSPGYWNTFEEIDSAISAVSAIAEFA